MSCKPIPTWVICSIIKGTTFNDRIITFDFDITDCIFNMQFKQQSGGRTAFEWSSESGTFEKLDANRLLMKSRILNAPVSNYVSDLRVKFPSNEPVRVYFKASIGITQNITDIQ